jgi:hypothetical protein
MWFAKNALTLLIASRAAFPAGRKASGTWGTQPVVHTNSVTYPDASCKLAITR